MIKKIFLQGFVLILIFFSTFLLAVQVDWIKLFRVREVNDKTEKKLGETIWEAIRESGTEVNSKAVVKPLDSLLGRICLSNKIKKQDIKIHVLQHDEINAFALPDGHLIIFTGLIENVDRPEELSAVMAHEIAHIQLNHVMKKLGREIGLSVLMSISGGNAGSELIKEVSRVLSSTAFDRGLEREADLRAVDYLVKANISPVFLSDFLARLPEKDAGLTWFSTHPESAERIKYIQEYSRGKVVINSSVISAKTWENLKQRVLEK